MTRALRRFSWPLGWVCVSLSFCAPLARECAPIMRLVNISLCLCVYMYMPPHTRTKSYANTPYHARTPSKRDRKGQAKAKRCQRSEKTSHGTRCGVLGTPQNQLHYCLLRGAKHHLEAQTRNTNPSLLLGGQRARLTPRRAKNDGKRRAKEQNQ